jgi:hypothetical protein
MKLTIIDKENNDPLVVLDDADGGLRVIGGNPKAVQALGLNQFRDLKSIENYINADPSSNLQAVAEDDPSEQEGPGLDEKIAPALKMIKELMERVSATQQQRKVDEEQEKPEAKAQRSMGAEIVGHPSEMYWVSFDGDFIGNAVARAEEADDERKLQEMSASINAGNQAAAEWCKAMGGSVLEMGGDEGVMKVPGTAIQNIEDLRARYQSIVGATLTVGIGKKISESTKARMLGKLKGKNRVEMFTDSTDKELKLREDEENPESKKIKVAMQGPGAPQDVAPSKEAQSEPVPASAPADAGEAGPDSREEEAAPRAGGQGEGGQGPVGEPGQEEFLRLPPELLKAVAQARPEEPAESILASAYHDPSIENADYSYSDDPEFSKSLRYVAKHRG